MASVSDSLQQNADNKRGRTADKPTDYAIAFFAACGVIVAIFQWNAMKAAVAESKFEAAKQSIDTQTALGHAKTAADAAKKAADVAEQSMRLSLRAELGLEGQSFRIENFAVNERWTFDCQIINSGRTTARLLTRSFVDGIAKRHPPIPVYPPPRVSTSEVLIGGGGWIGSGSMESVQPITADVYRAVIGGDLALIFWGLIEYIDVFEEAHTLGWGIECWTRDGKTWTFKKPTVPGYEYST